MLLLLVWFSFSEKFSFILILLGMLNYEEMLGWEEVINIVDILVEGVMEGYWDFFLIL